ncbi:MAG TPA: hypothetical protein VLW84_03960 [Terriglobales bacterium]|nr:hypothetical protein [Terriglobales bacterium]
MPAAGSQRQLDPRPDVKRSKTHIYSAEATGLLIIGLMILILTLVRYWHYINWSAR